VSPGDRPWLAALAAVVIVATTAPARAADPPRFSSALPAPRLPAPFALPELSHPRLDVGVDWFLGRVDQEGGDRNATAAIGRVSAEGSVVLPRRLFLGLTYPFAGALPPDGGLAPGEVGRPSGARTVLGNVEGHVRAVFPLPTWLEIGFTLAVVAPTARFERTRANRSATVAAASLDPTSQVHFLPDRVGLRLAGDLRILRGPFVLQARHGIDILIDDLGIDRAKVAGRLVAHVGWLVSHDVEVSVEGSQNYFFASDDRPTGASNADTAFAERYRITDGRRSAIAIGPGVRFATPGFDIGAAFVSNLSDPLSPAADGFVALRVSVIAHAGRL
jgi:hypothetical protein